jgi:hypothetical protein
MSDGAAHLVDRVLPEVPVRQWVCTLPWSLRVAAAYDRKLCSALIESFASALCQTMCARAKRLLGLGSRSEAQTGAVTVAQRSDASLRLNLHLHALMLDGVYVREPGGVRFEALQRRGRAHAARRAPAARAPGPRARRRGRERRRRAMDRRAACACAMRRGQRARRRDRRASSRSTALAPRGRAFCAGPPRKLAAQAGGFDAHASVAVDGRDRKLALDRLELRQDARVVVRFKRPWADGTRAVVLSPYDFIARLCALVPPPRSHLVRYHGVLAAHAALRKELVPEREAAPAAQQTLRFWDEQPLEPLPRTSARLPWASLLRRVFAADLTLCPKCGGQLRIREIITAPERMRELLGGPRARARAPPSRSHRAQLALPGI